jgi:AraC-like DNA-binding protein
VASTSCSERGLCALADPAIGESLKRMHGDPAHDWTIEELAKVVGMSRSAFAARFAELVGEPPLHYLTHWRMTKAAQQLRESDTSISAIAEQVGYRSSAAFMKAFTRARGTGPGAYRRVHRGEAHGMPTNERLV